MFFGMANLSETRSDVTLPPIALGMRRKRHRGDCRCSSPPFKRPFATLSATSRHPPRKSLMNGAFLRAPHYHHSKQTDFADRGSVIASSIKTHSMSAQHQRLDRQQQGLNPQQQRVH